MSVTMKQIAAKSGVSRPTVSMVLNGKGQHIGRDTRERIQRVADRLGYRPNAAARAVKRGRFGNIALLLSTHRHRSDLPPDLFRGIDEALTRRSLHLTIARLSDPELIDPERTPMLLREYMSDGMLVHYFDKAPSELEARITQAGLPCVWINCKRESNCVYPDDRAAAVVGTRRLLELGHRRVAFSSLTGTTHYSAADRYAGYAEAMTEAGLAPVRFGEPLRVAQEDRTAFYASALAKPDRPTAIFADTPAESLPLAFACATCGITLGRELSLTVFNDRQVDYGGVSVDTQLLPERQIGEESVTMLIEAIATQKSLPVRRIAVDHVPGASCGPPPAE